VSKQLDEIYRCSSIESNNFVVWASDEMVENDLDESITADMYNLNIYDGLAYVVDYTHERVYVFSLFGHLLEMLDIERGDINNPLSLAVRPWHYRSPLID